MIFILIIALLFISLFFGVYFVFLKDRKTEDGSYFEQQKNYIQQERERLEKELEEDNEFEDEFLKEETSFIAIGLLATALFVITGLFTGNQLYSFVGFFIITAIVFIFYLLPKDRM